jgi:tRNA modification GTPase
MFTSAPMIDEIPRIENRHQNRYFGNMKPFSSSEPIAALATPWGQSAIGVIRTSGDGCLDLLSSLFRNARSDKELAKGKGYSIHHGFVRDGDRELDEVLITVYRKPSSYTGEDSAEIYCHGGMVIIQQILKLLFKNGFRQAEPGEFTLRAFLNGKMDLTRAEAVNEIIRSKTERARELALSRLSGGIERKIQGIKESLIEVSAAVEVQIDYPDEDLEQDLIDRDKIASLQDELERLLSTYRTGKILQEGISVVIAGRTNAGKSTLFNLMLREDRAIVSDIHGTTRDYIEGAISIEGIPIRLFDTAGLRESRDPLEQEGMRRSDQIIRNADLMLFLVDATRGLEEKDRALMEEYSKHVALLPLWNKVDLSSEPPPHGFLPISSETGEGLSELHNEIARRILGESSALSGEPVIDSLRQRDLLERCLEALRSLQKGLADGMPLDVLAVDIREAIDSLGEITGEVVSEDILRKMFSTFCVGK